MTALWSGGLGIVLTDLFISATAALLIVLALAQPTPPVPIPVQADILVTCPIDPGAPLQAVAANAPESAEVSLTEPDDLAAAPARLSLAPALLYTIALRPGPDGQVPGPCFRRLRDDLVRARNDAVTEAPRDTPGPRAVFAVGLVRPTP